MGVGNVDRLGHHLLLPWVDNELVANLLDQVAIVRHVLPLNVAATVTRKGPLVEHTPDVCRIEGSRVVFAVIRPMVLGLMGATAAKHLLLVPTHRHLSLLQATVVATELTIGCPTAACLEVDLRDFILETLDLFDVHELARCHGLMHWHI